MTDLSAFPITRKWPAQYPEWIQLYSLPTPNGVKVSIMLEEIGLPYEPHRVSFETNDQMSPAFLSLNPNNKIPAITDPEGPDGRPFKHRFDYEASGARGDTFRVTLLLTTDRLAGFVTYDRLLHEPLARRGWAVNGTAAQHSHTGLAGSSRPGDTALVEIPVVIVPPLT